MAEIEERLRNFDSAREKRDTNHAIRTNKNAKVKRIDTMYAKSGAKVALGGKVICARPCIFP